jgi:hypothetical protein
MYLVEQVVLENLERPEFFLGKIANFCYSVDAKIEVFIKMLRKLTKHNKFKPLISIRKNS